jgi:hypothetical protein
VGSGGAARRGGGGGRLGRVGGRGEESAVGRSVEADLVAVRSWAAEAPPESGRMGRRWGQARRG